MTQGTSEGPMADSSHATPLRPDMLAQTHPADPDVLAWAREYTRTQPCPCDFCRGKRIHPRGFEVLLLGTRGLIVATVKVVGAIFLFSAGVGFGGGALWVSFMCGVPAGIAWLIYVVSDVVNQVSGSPRLPNPFLDSSCGH